MSVVSALNCDSEGKCEVTSGWDMSSMVLVSEE